jgi:signal transduction histidine kinase
LRRGINTAPEDLVAMLHEVAARFQDRPPGVRVVPTVPAIVVEVDGDKVRTVLRNLVENAIKYSQPRSRPVELSAVANADAVVVRVTDDGAGIAEGDVARIFEPFFRADRSRSKSTGGYGLGLSICKRVMEAHGGTIVVERSPAGGASFILTFPNHP